MSPLVCQVLDVVWLVVFVAGVAYLVLSGLDSGAGGGRSGRWW